MQLQQRIAEQDKEIEILQRQRRTTEQLEEKVDSVLETLESRIERLEGQAKAKILESRFERLEGQSKDPEHLTDLILRVVYIEKSPRGKWRMCKKKRTRK